MRYFIRPVPETMSSHTTADLLATLSHGVPLPAEHTIVTVTFDHDGDVDLERLRRCLDVAVQLYSSREV